MTLEAARRSHLFFRYQLGTSAKVGDVAEVDLHADLRADFQAVVAVSLFPRMQQPSKRFPQFGFMHWAGEPAATYSDCLLMILLHSFGGSYRSTTYAPHFRMSRRVG
jgi:hypothetical protein